MNLQKIKNTIQNMTSLDYVELAEKKYHIFENSVLLYAVLSYPCLYKKIKKISASIAKMSLLELQMYLNTARLTVEALQILNLDKRLLRNLGKILKNEKKESSFYTRNLIEELRLGDLKRNGVS